MIFFDHARALDAEISEFGQRIRIILFFVHLRPQVSFHPRNREVAGTSSDLKHPFFKSSQDQRAFLLAHLESSERCVSVLEADQLG